MSLARAGFRIKLLMTPLDSGSDSAPHPLTAKRPAGGAKAAAGVFTQPYATQLVVWALENAIRNGHLEQHDFLQENLEEFLCHRGRRFYKLPPADRSSNIALERGSETITPLIKSADGSIEVPVSRGGEPVRSLRWI